MSARKRQWKPVRTWMLPEQVTLINDAVRLLEAERAGWIRETLLEEARKVVRGRQAADGV